MRHAALALLLALSTATQASGLGRLFFTPEQRAQLEFNHARNVKTDGRGAPSMPTLNGIVQQRGGARTVWINGAAQNSGHGGESAAEEIAVPGKSLPIKIKVGQKLLLGFPNTDAPPSSPASAE